MNPTGTSLSHDPDDWRGLAPEPHPDADLRALWVGVLERAWLDAHGEVETWQNASLDATQAEAQRWFASDSREPGSFRFVCGVLGLEPGAVRGRL